MSSNPKLYRELSVPFETAEEAQAIFSAFFEELGELRKKHGFQNVHVIVMDNFLDNGEESAFITNGHYGSMAQAEAMTAWALGIEHSSREALIGQLAAGKKK